MVKKVILDSSFIISAAKKKIDIFEEIPFMGIKIVVPDEVIAEIEGVKNSKQKLKEREGAELALKILGANKYESVKLGKSYVDNGLRKYAKEHPSVIIATLDKQLKKDIPNYLMVIRGEKKLEIL
jgi:rRNA-processing protein FCF1